jgi:hypothetical protein
MLVPIDQLVGIDGNVDLAHGIYMSNKWATVIMVDGILFDGTIKKETSYGIYLHIGGDESRLSLFPWHVVSRVVYKI